MKSDDVVPMHWDWDGRFDIGRRPWWHDCFGEIFARHCVRRSCLTGVHGLGSTLGQEQLHGHCCTCRGRIGCIQKHIWNGLQAQHLHKEPNISLQVADRDMSQS